MKEERKTSAQRSNRQVSTRGLTTNEHECTQRGRKLARNHAIKREQLERRSTNDEIMSKFELRNETPGRLAFPKAAKHCRTLPQSRDGRDSMRTFLACVLECGRAPPLCIKTTKNKPLGAACALCHSNFVISSSLHIRTSSLLTGTDR